MTSDTASKRQDELVEKEGASEEEAPGIGGVRYEARFRASGSERFRGKRAVSTPSRLTHTWVRSVKHDARITDGRI